MTHYVDFTAHQWSQLSPKSPGLVQEPDKQIGNPTECKYCPEETAPAETQEVEGSLEKVALKLQLKDDQELQTLRLREAWAGVESD